MKHEKLINELQQYYFNECNDRTDRLLAEITDLLDEGRPEGLTNAYKMKAYQYGVIADRCEPIVFASDPFYYETGFIPAHSDGSRDFRGHSHAAGWTFRKNADKFTLGDPELQALIPAQKSERMYLICGAYFDQTQHFQYNYLPILKGGLKCLYEKAEAQLSKAVTDEQRDYLETTLSGLLDLKKLCEKFADAARRKLEETTDEKEIRDLERMIDSASYTPWNAPRTFYEALNTFALLRKAVSTLEGIGFNTFGRPDIDLLPFYEKDIADGTLTKDEAYELISKFLLTFDCHYDHDMKMVGYSDHEMENTYTLGGCDAQGKPIFNDLTEMFLRATREFKIIYPKIKCRFSSESPKEYFDAINEDVINGTSSILYQNDDAVIPALVKYGRTIEEARDYIVTGCWGLMVRGTERPDNGNYVNLLKPLEYAVHDRKDKMKAVGMAFKTLDDADSFEEVYSRMLYNYRILFEMRNRISRLGKDCWHNIDPLPLMSAPLESCLDKLSDFTTGGAKYQDDQYMLVGFPNVTDSLLAIKTLCFDKKKYTLPELLKAVRANWDGYEDIRRDCIACPFWGDNDSATNAFAKRFNSDLCELALKLPETAWGGKTQIGHLTYTEIRFWGEQTLATPDGRRSGEYFSQGLTPSRIHDIRDVTSVVNSLAALGAEDLAGNNVVNIILPSASANMNLEICEAFLRACAHSAMQSIQLNCVTKEELLDAQIHPENHRDLIVRVCGFSARFTSLSPEWQAEVLSRNFYD